jgi:hypothetical protein
MNGILIATRTGIAPALVPQPRPMRRHAGASTDGSAGGSAGNRAIQTLTVLLRRVFRSSRTDLQAAANTYAGMRSIDIGRGLSPALCKTGDSDGMQDRAIAKQDPDIASASPARRLSSIVGMPPDDATEGTAMSTIAFPSSLQNPPAPGRVAGSSWLQALSQLWRGTRATEAEEISFALPTHPLPSLGFREFTAPRRLQGGGVLRLRTKAAGRIAAFDGLQSKRGRRR